MLDCHAGSLRHVSLLCDGSSDGLRHHDLLRSGYLRHVDHDDPISRLIRDDRSAFYRLDDQTSGKRKCLSGLALRQCPTFPGLQKPGITIKYHSILGESLGIDRSMGTGEFQVKPGMVTLCRLIEREGQFKMLISKGEIVPSKQNLRGSWSWVQVPDLDKLYNTLVMEGFTHHASLIHGDYDSCDPRCLRIFGY